MAQAVLPVIMDNMVTISICPYTLRKVGLATLTLLCLSCLSAFAQSSFIAVNSTPYDRQMSRIRPILTSTVQDRDQNLSIALVNNWIGNLRAIPYGFSMEWKTPDEVRVGAYADCKGKAVALYNTMHSRGADNVRLVIGKRLWTSHKTHAWLEWTTASGTYILDPTINWSACRAGRTGRSSYIPLYAYDGGKKFRAAAGSGLLASNQLGGAGAQHVASRL
jgi:predicted transglutaminase-like cysteine proteinase